MKTYARVLFNLAWHSMDRAIAGHAVPGRIYGAADEVVEVIALTGMSLEAGINEIADEPGIKPAMLPEFDNLTVEQKWSLVPRLANGSRFDVGALPWQDFSTLVALRNAVVHIKADGRVPRAWKRLNSLDLVIPTTIDGAEHQLASCLTLMVGKWAVNVVSAMFAELSRLLEREAEPRWPWASRHFPAYTRDLPTIVV